MDYYSLFNDVSRDEKLRCLNNSFQNLTIEPELLNNVKTDQQLMEKIISFMENHP